VHSSLSYVHAAATLEFALNHLDREDMAQTNVNGSWRGLTSRDAASQTA